MLDTASRWRHHSLPSGTATEVPIQWEEDLWTLHGIPSEGYAYADDVITKLVEKAGADSCIVVLSW